MVSDVEHISPVGKSDHETLVFSLYVCEEKQKEQEQELKYDLNKGNFAQMRTEFDEFDWSCTIFLTSA